LKLSICLAPLRLRCRKWSGVAVFLALAGGLMLSAQAQNPAGGETARPRRILLIFGESRDLPGNVLMETALRREMSKHLPQLEFFIESVDAGRFPNAEHLQMFGEYLKSKYAGQPPDLVLLFTARDFQIVRELSAMLATSRPAIVVAVNELEVPAPIPGHPFTGIFQRFDIPGTIKFILQLQPETRRVVVIGGTSPADAAGLQHIQETARAVDGVTFEYWTNLAVREIHAAAKALPPDTVILLSSLQRDVTGQPLYGSQVVQTLAPTASVPVYVLGNGLIGTGALGGDVVDFEALGTSAGQLALRTLAGTPQPVEIKSTGTPMVDWRAMQRWHIKPGRLPANCVIRYQPRSLWEEHKELFLLLAAGFLAQAVTIAALLVQRRRQRQAEAEILRQRAELAHVSRVSMMGQLASALTHELNQPLGAILRNAEAAEVYLQAEAPDLKEIQAILTDIRRDDKRAGNVIDRMRSLFKRQPLALGTLDMRDLVEDTIAMARPDASQRGVRLKVEISPHLPPAQGDRVHIQQVLLNLILNGMDAMSTIPAHRRRLTVGIAETNNGNLRLRVADCGTGIAAENAAHIFEPFFSTKSNGMGMGLAISKTIIEAHGGEIWMDSEVLKGTTFTCLLPPAGGEKLRPGDLPGGL
jgi:signal transduction histidine kinase